MDYYGYILILLNAIVWIQIEGSALYHLIFIFYHKLINFTTSKTNSNHVTEINQRKAGLCKSLRKAIFALPVTGDKAR